MILSGISFIEYSETYSIATKQTYTKANTDMIPVTAVMLSLALIIFILFFVFWLVISKSLKLSREVINYNGGTVYPNNLAMNPNGVFYPQNLQANNSYLNNYPNLSNQTVY